MFKVKWVDKEYIIYSVKYDETIEDTFFLVYDDNKWQWISCCLCEPIIDKEDE